MSSRRLDALRDAAVQAAPAIHVLVLDGIPRISLKTSEVVAVTGLHQRWVLAEIKAGRIRAITGGKEFVIPVGELAGIVERAECLPRTA